MKQTVPWLKDMWQFVKAYDLQDLIFLNTSLKHERKNTYWGNENVAEDGVVKDETAKEEKLNAYLQDK